MTQRLPVSATFKRWKTDHWTGTPPSCFALFTTPTQALIEACKRHGEVYVNHKDSNKLNTNVSNLEWCNQTYNCYHAVTEETKQKLSGENCYHAKLTENVVLEIVAEYSSGGVTQQQLADKYGVKQITISNILTGYSWSTVTGIPKKQRKFKHRQKPMKD